MLTSIFKYFFLDSFFFFLDIHMQFQCRITEKKIYQLEQTVENALKS